MKTREQVVAIGDSPIELWHDTALREAICWKPLRDKCEEMAAASGMTLAADAAEQHVVFMRWVDSGTGEPALVEDVIERADIARCRLVTWAQKP